MQATFEKLGGTYRQKGDYLLPNVEVPENPAAACAVPTSAKPSSTVSNTAHT